jgi:hypothetical protein
MAGIASLIRKGVFGSIFSPLGMVSGLSLPRTGLLFYSNLPNTEEVLWADDLVIGDEYYMFGGWKLTEGSAGLFAAAPDFYDGDADTPLPLRDTEILALAGINTDNVLFSLSKGLAVYDPATDEAILAKARKYFGITGA